MLHQHDVIAPSVALVSLLGEATLPHRDRIPPPRCPECEEGVGSPIAVSMRRGSKTVTFKCERCNHEWSVTVDISGQTNKSD